MQALLTSFPAWPVFATGPRVLTLVLLDAVEQVSRNVRGHQIVHVKGSEEKLEVSRTFNHLFKQM